MFIVLTVPNSSNSQSFGSRFLQMQPPTTGQALLQYRWKGGTSYWENLLPYILMLPGLQDSGTANIRNRNIGYTVKYSVPCIDLWCSQTKLGRISPPAPPPPPGWTCRMKLWLTKHGIFCIVWCQRQWTKGTCVHLVNIHTEFAWMSTNQLLVTSAVPEFKVFVCYFLWNFYFFTKW